MTNFLQLKIVRYNFLARFDQNIAKKYLTILSYKRLARIFISLQESARLTKYEQHLILNFVSLARKILARLSYFLQNSFYWEAIGGHIYIHCDGYVDMQVAIYVVATRLNNYKVHG